jgi:hypothetical protein
MLAANSGSVYSDARSQFMQSAAIYGGGVSFEKTEVSLSNTIFERNYAYMGGGAMVISESHLNSINSAIFRYNFAYDTGGGMRIDSSSTFSLTNSSFTGNVADDSSIMFILGLASPNSINGGTYSENIGSTGNGISIMFTDITITGIAFKNNQAYYSTPGIFLTFSNTTIDNSTFINTEFGEYATTQDAADAASTTGGFLMLSVSATLKVTDSHFTAGYSNAGG